MRSLEFHRTGSNTIATEPLLGLSEVDREQTILFYQRGTPIELEDAETGAFLTELKERLAAEGGVARAVRADRPAAARVHQLRPRRPRPCRHDVSTPCEKLTSSPGWTPMR